MRKRTMIHPTNIHPLTDFKRNTPAFLKRLRKTGEPEVLTIDGRGALIVQDVEAYRRMLEEIEQAQTLAAIRQGIADVEAWRTTSRCALVGSRPRIWSGPVAWNC